VGRLPACAVKIFADGVFENRTAAMLAPYLDGDGRPGDNLGIGMLGPEELARAVTALDAEDVHVHVHAIGDRAGRDTLDAFGAAAAATPATRSPTSSSSTPTTGPGSVASAWSPTPSRSGRAWTATCAS
jgi:predicted amidohydrolase YtcJ